MDNALDKKLSKYLRTRAVTSPWTLAGPGRRDYDAAIVIPALAEAQSLPGTLDSLASNPAGLLRRTLVVVVVNNRSGATAAVREDNRATLDWLRSDPCPDLQLARVDAAAAGLELAAGEGVGLARKIGFDLALSRLDWNGDPLLVSLDADTLVDEHYLPALFRHFSLTSRGGTTLPFRHQPGESPEQEQAIRDYELYLRSYLFGLQRAGSPYAYLPVGSAFACRATAYIAAGGMNRRSAAEDFYFLQQLAKVTGIAPLRGTLVRPSSRVSERVPFGTGRVVESGMDSQASPYRMIPAAAFQVLKDWLERLPELLDRAPDALLRHAADLAPELGEFLQELQFSRYWPGIAANHADPQRRLQAFHHWFDALRTRQLLSRLASDEPDTENRVVAELLRWGGEPALDCAREQLAFLESRQLAGSAVLGEAGGGAEGPSAA